MKYVSSIWIFPTERVPIDILADVADSVTITSVQKSVYDVADNAKTDVSATVVDSVGIPQRDTIRIVLHNMTLGKLYHVQVEGEASSSATFIITDRLIRCGYQSEDEKLFPYGGRLDYELNFESKLPSNVTVNATTGSTAYRATDLSTDLWNTLATGASYDGRKITLSLENMQVNENYIVNVLAGTTTDSFTGSTYLAGKRLYIQCREQ
jgi:hypothetical protein